VAIALLSAASTALARDSRPLSAAQVALFESNHLELVREPIILHYHFDRTDRAAGFTDAVAIGVTPQPDGSKDVRVEFLTGDRRRPFPPAIGFNGNPVLMFFLEHDVAAMQKTTGGGTQYFRNRIRQALVDRAQVARVSISVDGREAPATEIVLAPFRGDPMIAKFGRLEEKSYRFVLSDDVPGAIYQIATTIPSEDALRAVTQETMTFAGTRPCSDSTPCEPRSSSR
jgi:hypothetical protein